MASNSDKPAIQKAVLSEVRALFLKAGQVAEKDSNMADRYVRKAKRAAQKARTSIPPDLRKRFCRFCGSYWVPGSTVRVRLQKQKVVYYCLKCRHYTRHPYVREKKAKRKAKKAAATAAAAAKG